MGQVVNGVFYPETDAEFVAYSHGFTDGRQRGLEDGVDASMSRMSGLSVAAEGTNEKSLRFHCFEEACTALRYLKDQVLTRRQTKDAV